MLSLCVVGEEEGGPSPLKLDDDPLADRDPPSSLFRQRTMGKVKLLSAGSSSPTESKKKRGLPRTAAEASGRASYKGRGCAVGDSSEGYAVDIPAIKLGTHGAKPSWFVLDPRWPAMRRWTAGGGYWGGYYAFVFVHSFHCNSVRLFFARVKLLRRLN